MYDVKRTEDGIEIRDGDKLVTVADTWPPRDEETLDQLFNEASISQPTKGVLKVLFGVIEVKDERDQN